MTEQESVQLERQLRELCGFLPLLSADPGIRVLVARYQRGEKHMLHSDNARRLLDEVQQHLRALRRLAHVLAAEAHISLAQRASAGRR
jgi:hypothetical protein